MSVAGDTARLNLSRLYIFIQEERESYHMDELRRMKVALNSERSKNQEMSEQLVCLRKEVATIDNLAFI